MAFRITALNEIETTEARERELTGWVAGTVDTLTSIDTTATLDTTDTVSSLLHTLGIHFTSPDGFISIFSDGSIEANTFIEGSRISLDDSANLTVFFLREVD